MAQQRKEDAAAAALADEIRDRPWLLSAATADGIALVMPQHREYPLEFGSDGLFSLRSDGCNYDTGTWNTGPGVVSLKNPTSPMVVCFEPDASALSSAEVHHQNLVGEAVSAVYGSHPAEVSDGRLLVDADRDGVSYELVFVIA